MSVYKKFDENVKTMNYLAIGHYYFFTLSSKGGSPHMQNTISSIKHRLALSDVKKGVRRPANRNV